MRTIVGTGIGVALVVGFVVWLTHEAGRINARYLQNPHVIGKLEGCNVYHDGHPYGGSTFAVCHH